MSTRRKFAYFGTPKVASDTLAFLLSQGLTPSVVVTSPDAPKGRGLVLTPSPVKELALSRGLPVLTPEKITPEFIAELGSYGCDYAVVVAYGKILPEALIASFPLGVLNVHYSLLPKYRGATPMEGALLAGDSITGVTIQKMVYELDAGDILAQEELAIGPEETARELRSRLIEAGAQLLAATLPRYERGEITSMPQDHSKATRSGKFQKEDAELDLSAPGEVNWRKYRAYADTIGTFFFENGKRMKITKASLKNGKFIVERVIPEGKRETDYPGA